MDPDVRTALLATGIIFCVGFAAMTLSVAAESSGAWVAGDFLVYDG